MAATPKPKREKQKLIATEMRKHGREVEPRKGVRKAIEKSAAKHMKKVTASSRPVNMVKSMEAGEYEPMMKARRKAGKSVKKLQY